MKNALEINYLLIDTVKPSPHHARSHGGAQRKKLKSLLEKYGQVAPIIVDQDNFIVDGHAVHAVLNELGYDEIAAVVVTNLTEAEIRALRLALNRVAEEAAWDAPKLKGEFDALLELGFDLELTAFDMVEIDVALSIDDVAGDAVEEVAAADIEPSGTPPVTQPGDIWKLDRHVVGCGDARDGDHLRYLMPDVRGAVIFTDPPYNVPVRGHVSGLGKHDHREFPMASGEMTRADFVTFLSAFLSALKAFLVDGAILFVAMDWRHASELLEAAGQQDLEFKNLCVWVKTNAGMGSFYRSQHELIFVFKHGDAPHQNNFLLGQHGRSRTNVWRYAGVNSFGKNRDELLGAHPTCKPVAMIADALKDVSSRGDHVIDPFLGSGSTLLAAETTGRICIGNELDPGYVDVTIRRWQKETGKDAMHAVTGMTFDETAAAAEAANALANDVPVAGLPAAEVSTLLVPALPGGAPAGEQQAAAAQAGAASNGEGDGHD